MTSARTPTAIPSPAEEPGAEERRHEQHRLEQVRDAVEAAGLRGAERRERNRLRVEPEREEVAGEEGGTGEAEREQRGRQAEQRDDPPAGEPQVGGEREEDDPRREARQEDRGEVGEAAGEDAQPEPPVVVPLDPAVETLERGDGIVHLDDLEPSVRDVGERHEAGDPRRVRREDTAGARRDGDRVPRVPALALGRQDDQRVRRRAAIELDQGPPGRRPAEQRALHLAREERVQRALAGDCRAGAGDREADRARAHVLLERERLDDTDGGGGGRGDHHERDEDRCEAARHGRSLAQCPA